MMHLSAESDIRAAYCTITDKTAFLKDLKGHATAFDTHIICFNADMITGRIHAESAIALAVRAFRNGQNISNTIEMEALLFAAGSRQCSIAASFGIHDGSNRVWVCCIPRREGVLKALGQLFHFTDENWDMLSEGRKERLLKNFSISAEEIDAAGGESRIADLVLERIALLQVLR